MAGVLGILVEVDQRVEQGVEAAGPGEVGGLDPAGVGLGGAGGRGEGEQGADAERGGRGGGDQLPPLEAGLEAGLRGGAGRPLVELILDRGEVQGVVQRLGLAAEAGLAQQRAADGLVGGQPCSGARQLSISSSR